MKIVFEKDRTMLEILRETMSHCEEQNKKISYIELTPHEWEQMRFEHNQSAFGCPHYISVDEIEVTYYGIRLVKVKHSP